MGNKKFTSIFLNKKYYYWRTFLTFILILIFIIAFAYIGNEINCLKIKILRLLVRFAVVLYSLLILMIIVFWDKDDKNKHSYSKYWFSNFVLVLTVAIFFAFIENTFNLNILLSTLFAFLPIVCLLFIFLLLETFCKDTLVVFFIIIVFNFIAYFVPTVIYFKEFSSISQRDVTFILIVNSSMFLSFILSFILLNYTKSKINKKYKNNYQYYLTVNNGKFENFFIYEFNVMCSIFLIFFVALIINFIIKKQTPAISFINKVLKAELKD